MTRLLKMTLYLKDPSYHDENDNFYPGMMEPIEGMWCTDVSACDHESTTCFDCLDGWSEDYVGVVHTDNKDLPLDQIVDGRVILRVLKQIIWPS